ncbi:hypothetical protein EDD11_006821 [Mortierella claussenii]|nr:hypothetical protein EDD11_006821 [Mortierella claussenii]
MPRLSMAPNGFRINSFNIHRLLITCLMVAAKFTSDLFYSNARYAKVGGLSLLELNQLELEFLFTTRFELNVRVEELQRVGNALLRFKDREMVPRQQDQAQAQTLQQQQWQADRPGCQELQTANAHLCTAAASASTEGDSGGHRQQQTSGRFSIPSPTSPRNGPMSDRPTLTLISSSVSSSCSIASVSSTVAASSSSSSGSNGTTVVVVSGARLQRTQLLSPPEEKHSWAESEGVQMTQDLIHGPVEQDREASVSSAIQSFSSSSSSSSSS